jgi:hypothetical protein
VHTYSVYLEIGLIIKATSKKEVERKLKDMVLDDYFIHNSEIEKQED